jgi:hypothetical protein
MTDTSGFAASVCPCCGLDRCRHCGVVLVGHEPWHREWCVKEVWEPTHSDGTSNV